jgi:urease gamma subunit
MSDATAPVDEADLEERLRDLVLLCEAVRVLCARGEERGLTLADGEGVAVLAAQLAAEVQRAVLRSASGAPPDPCC